MNTKITETNIKNFIERRKGDGLANSTIKTEMKILEQFNKWCIHNNIDYFNYEVIDNYLKTLKCGKQIFNKTRCTLSKLYDFVLNNKYSIITFRKETIILNQNYKNEFYEYINLINDKFDRCTIGNKKAFLKYFLNFLSEERINTLSDLKQYDVTCFLNSCITKYSKAYFNKIAYFVREYLNYLFNKNIISFNGYSAIPKLNTCYGTSLPTTYSSEEIKKVLSSVDRTTKIGKRDYLILLCLSVYGIRIGDICNMKISSFNLETNKLKFITKKTNKTIELPLFDEVKYAYIDYLKNSRPNYESEYLLITHTKPHRNYDKKGLRDIVPKYLKIAEINTIGKKRGAHALRHSLASNMLSNGSNIKQISDILGHECISTSNQYLTIDINKLQELSLELPKDCIEEDDYDE